MVGIILYYKISRTGLMYITFRHKLRYKQVEQENFKLEQEKEQLQVSRYLAGVCTTNHWRA